MKSMKMFILTSAALGLFASLACAQLPGLEGNGYGSHNTPEDIANSLKPVAPKRGKEKTEQVDPSKLHSSSLKNTTFEGSLLDAGTAQSVKLDKSHLSTEKEKSEKSSAANETSATAKTADTSGDKEKTSKPGDVTGDGHARKKEKQASTPTGQSEDKAAATKTDGGR